MIARGGDNEEGNCDKREEGRNVSAGEIIDDSQSKRLGQVSDLDTLPFTSRRNVNAKKITVMKQMRG